MMPRERRPRATRTLLGQVAHRVDGLAVDPHLEVKVGPEAEARAVAYPDHLPLAHVLADRDGDRRLMRVAGRDPASVVDAGVVAVAGLRPGDRDRAVGGGVDRRSARDSDVDARVAALPGALLAEGRGHRSVDRPDE